MLRHSDNWRLLREGHAVLALNPEAGHMLMGYEDLAYAFRLACEQGRLAHMHWNSQPLGNYDQDLNVGVVSIEQTEAALYAQKMHGHEEYFGIDVNPERMPAAMAVRNSIDALRAAADRVNGLNHGQIVWAMMHPTAGGLGIPATSPSQWCCLVRKVRKSLALRQLGTLAGQTGRQNSTGFCLRRSPYWPLEG